MGVQDEWSGAFQLPNQARIHTICLTRSCQHGMVGLGSFLKLLILLPKWECALEWGPEAVDEEGQHAMQVVGWYVRISKAPVLFGILRLGSLLGGSCKSDRSRPAQVILFLCLPIF